MRILRFMGYPINNFSTLERMVLSQAAELNRRGHHVEIAFDGIGNALAAADAQQFAPEVRLHFNLPFPVGPKKPFLALNYSLAARRLIASGNFDIVHLYFEPGAAILNQVARLFPNIKFLRTIGSTPVPRGKRRYLDHLKQRKWQFDLAQMNRVICVGDHIREILARYGIPEHRLLVIPNAVDVQHFRRVQPHQRDDKLRLAFIGRLDPVKNIELLVGGLSVLVHEYGVDDVHLTLFGEGKMQNTLKALAVEQRVSDYISFAGQVRNVAEVLNKNVDVYVQASHNEGCAAAPVEAMACEVPVVLSAIKGHEQVAKPDLHASFFAAGDPNDFARRILEIRADYGYYQERAKRAREHVVSKYSIQAWIESEFTLYNDMLLPSQLPLHQRVML